jgi:uncharacterized protein YfkK (UPF0435 family)
MTNEEKNLDQLLTNIKTKLKFISLKEIIKKYNRQKGQENCKIKKSFAMKEYWKLKKKKEEEKINDLKYINGLIKSERYTSCTCFLGNPPCTFCTDSNYCGQCNIQTWDEECPKCGQNISKD